MTSPVAKAQMLIRKPIGSVFEAFVNPGVTSHFWFSNSTGTLEPGGLVRWSWEMYGLTTDVEVKALEQNKRILVEWNRPSNPSLVEWTFEPKAADRTFVVVKNWGFHGDTEQIVSAALDSASGFAFVLAAAKAYLEYGVELRVVEDHAPDALAENWKTRLTPTVG